MAELPEEAIVGICPYCNDHVKIGKDVKKLYWYVYCENCNVQTYTYLNQDTAIAMWQAVIIENVRFKEKLDDTA